MTTRTRPDTTRPTRARLMQALRRLSTAADEYTLHTFNAQRELRGRR